MAAQRVMLALCAGLALISQADEQPPPAYHLAAQAAGVPPAVLYAVALQESAIRIRGQLRPWPWTLNVAGQPLRFARREEACRALRRALVTTAPTRVDIGLGQINWGYHHHRFTSPCAALVPHTNLAVAAQLLREQHRLDGDWVQTAGRYHRPAGGAPAARYRAGFARHLARLQSPPEENRR